MPMLQSIEWYVDGEIMDDKCLNGLYSKNHDYGDLFAKLRNGLPGSILDKYLRFKTLLDGAAQKVKDENIDDTLMDLANYCIMELVERKMENERII